MAKPPKERRQKEEPTAESLEEAAANAAHEGGEGAATGAPTENAEVPAQNLSRQRCEQLRRKLTAKYH